MSSTTADPVESAAAAANACPVVNDPTAESCPTTAAPSAEAVGGPAALGKKKSPNSKSKKKRQHAALQSMISQLKHLCTQVGQQNLFVDATAKLMDDMSPTDLDTAPSSPYSFCVERGMRIPQSVWKPQPAPGHAAAAAHPAAAAAFRSGLPAPREIRLTAVERECLQREERQKEIRMKLRCAVSVAEFEALLKEAEGANMKHEAELARRKIQKLSPTTSA